MEWLAEAVQGVGGGRYLKCGEEALFALNSHPANPLLDPRALGLTWWEEGRLRMGAVFNGGAALHGERVLLLPRCHTRYRRRYVYDSRLGVGRPVMDDYVSEVWVLESRDGLRFEETGVVLRGDGSEHRDFTYGIEDVRAVEVPGVGFLLVGCGKVAPPFAQPGGDRVALYTTRDFRHIEYRGIIDAFDSRNAAPFPVPVDSIYYMLLRFHPHIHLAPLRHGLDQLLEPQRYRDEWKNIYRGRAGNLLLEAGKLPHEREKIGPGPPPIATREGWLLIYHGVGALKAEVREAFGLRGAVGRSYSVCAALLDPNDPRRVRARTRYPLYIPAHPWEQEGDAQHPVDIPMWSSRWAPWWWETPSSSIVVLVTSMKSSWAVASKSSSTTF